MIVLSCVQLWYSSKSVATCISSATRIISYINSLRDSILVLVETCENIHFWYYCIKEICLATQRRTHQVADLHYINISLDRDTHHFHQVTLCFVKLFMNDDSVLFYDESTAAQCCINNSTSFFVTSAEWDHILVVSCQFFYWRRGNVKSLEAYLYLQVQVIVHKVHTVFNKAVFLNLFLHQGPTSCRPSCVYTILRLTIQIFCFVSLPRCGSQWWDTTWA